MLHTSLAREKSQNRVMLRVILTSLRYLVRQGLAIRGRYKIVEESNEGCEIDSNFIQLLKTRAEGNPLILNWLESLVIVQISRMKSLASWQNQLFVK